MSVSGIAAISSSTELKIKDHSYRPPSSLCLNKVTGRGSDTGQPAPGVAGVSDFVNDQCVPGIDVNLVPHVVFFSEDEETLAKVLSMLPLLPGTVKSPPEFQ